MAERPPTPFFSAFRWFPEFRELGRKLLRPQARLMVYCLLVGVIAGLGAVLFYVACQLVSWIALVGVVGYHPTEPRGEKTLGFLPELATTFTPWLLLIVPTVGGLLSGLLVYTLAPEAEGHGTDAAIEAYHHHNGYIRPRVPLVKIVASALSLGTGGSGGREGPIAQIGAGFGSFLGTTLRLRPEHRRVLMAAGMGAGVAAIFRAPLAGALFAAEVLYSSPDFESEVIIPAGLASVAAYCTFGSFFGWKSLFDPDPAALEVLKFGGPWELLPYSLLALLMVVLAMLYTRSFYGLTALFHRLPIKPHFRPAVGAFLTGAIGLALYLGFAAMSGPAAGQQVLGVLSFGYGSLQYALDPQNAQQSQWLLALLFAALALGKIATTGLTIGSGGSGGVFGPSMVIGGCGGGALGIVLHSLFPVLAPHPATFVVVGMAGFFAAAAKTPFSTLVIVSEMTGNYNLLLPTLWVCALAFLLSDKRSIYRAQVTSRALSPAHHGYYVREVLAGLQVGQFLEPGEVASLHPGDSLDVVVQRLAAHSGNTLPVTDAAGVLLGVVTLEEVHLASQSPHLRRLVVASDLMRTPIIPLRSEDQLDRAIELFAEQDLLELPVVDGVASGRVVGLVKRFDVSREYLRRVQGLPVQDGVAAGRV